MYVQYVPYVTNEEHLTKKIGVISVILDALAEFSECCSLADRNRVLRFTQNHLAVKSADFFFNLTGRTSPQF
jgi:hypothetical protein